MRQMAALHKYGSAGGLLLLKGRLSSLLSPAGSGMLSMN